MAETTRLVTTYGGVVHREDCKVLRSFHARYPWRPADDGPGVARACRKCLPDGLPEGAK